MHALLMMSIAAAAAAPPTSLLPRPVNPAGWISYSDYPPPALRAGIQGTTWFDVFVDPIGKPFACRTILSTGNTDLDQLSCALMLARSRFEPAQDDLGVPIAGAFRRSITWSIPEYRAPPKADMPADAVITVNALPNATKGSVLVRLVEAADGKVESCAVEKTSDDAQLDGLACAQASKAKFQDPIKGDDEAPIRAVRLRKITFITAPLTPDS